MARGEEWILSNIIRFLRGKGGGEEGQGRGKRGGGRVHDVHSVMQS